MTKTEHDQPKVDPPAQAGPSPDAASEPKGADASATEAQLPHADEKKSRWGTGKKEKRQIEELTLAKEAAEQAQAALHDRLLRLQADFDNFRKRTVREKAELFRTANEDLLAELLPVVDHFELAFGSVESGRDNDAFTRGVRMVRDQLIAVLGKFGLQPLEAAGQTFDPARHEAISHLPSETVPENGILVQTRRGYLLGDKLLRPAQVVVSSGNPHAAPPPGAPAPEGGSAAPTESTAGKE
ncbi:MAG: nucleotide exchange factor GrpE [Lentisphaerae bacterium]|nr:nucleotide exchange factor GrpE [Lentisphaerota bacterium]